MNFNKIVSRAAQNWPAKVVSAALAIALFVFNRMSNLEERFFSTPLHVQTGGDLVPATSYPRMIRVGLRGEANNLYPILEEDIEVYLDLSRYVREGAYRVPVQILKRGTALGVEPLEISVDPTEVFIELDQKVSKYVSLTPGLHGYVEPGYELVSYTLTPSQVVVDGPLRLMESLSTLTTDAIELGGRSEDFAVSPRILNPDPLLIIRGDGITEFRGRIQSLLIIRNFESVPIRFYNLDADLVAEPEIKQGSLRLQGTQKELENYNGAGILLKLDGGDITEPGEYYIPVQAEFPSFFTLIRNEPAEVKVQVSRLEEAENR
ncbi:MAG: hypothetical protein LBG76_09015 [Treponema sp.]|jgi:YbbR domain-containing protein|nr:hypothetical protein [Treponema sp.]